MHLHQSKIWKQVAILPADSHELVEVHHRDKDYLGRYSDEKKVTLDSLNKTALAIRERLHAYCPNCELSSVKIYIFSQVFVA